MADFDFGNEQSFEQEDVKNITSKVINSTEFSTTTNDKHKMGLSNDELKDPNKINVTIADKKTPIIILYGPPSSGKTMTLVRLTRYLGDDLGYRVSPIKTFRPSYDENYKKVCADFDNMINATDAAHSTERINFMLVEVLKNGKRICQILEAPGEYYFDKKNPTAKYPNFVNTILNGDNRKIWCILVEPDWEDESDRKNYVTRITNLKQRMRPVDKVVFLFNKIDMTPFVISRGKVNIGEARREVGENLYRGIFIPFKNLNPITSFFKQYNCDFVPFQTGDYTESEDSYTYQEGPKEYPALLWSKICKLING